MGAVGAPAPRRQASGVTNSSASLRVGNTNGVLQTSPGLPVCGLPWENGRRPQPQRGCGEERGIVLSNYPLCTLRKPCSPKPPSGLGTPPPKPQVARNGQGSRPFPFSPPAPLLEGSLGLFSTTPLALASGRPAEALRTRDRGLRKRRKLAKLRGACAVPVAANLRARRAFTLPLQFSEPALAIP